MPKTRVVLLTIKNSTGYRMTEPTPTFKSGRLADGWEFPTTIEPGTVEKVEMYEKDNTWAGCSGYVTYIMNNGYVTIAFSNPSVGKNKLGCGITGEDVWDNMSDHKYKPFSASFTINGEKFIANMLCTGGDVNKADITLSLKT